MKTRAFYRLLAGVGVCALAALAACSDLQPTVPSVGVAAADGELAARIAAMGFRPDMIVDEGEHFRVEGDIVIHKRDLAGPALDRVAAPGGPAFQWYTPSVITQTKMAGGVRVNLSAISSNAAWTTATRNAMSSYVNTSNNKIYLSEGSPADISVTFGTLPSGVIAQASFPAGGFPGPTITISTAYANSLTSSQKQWLMVHEFGHTLGYRHANWQGLGESQSGALQVPGTPASDLGSVMVGGQGAKSWSGFSSYDHQANGYLFPTGPLTITSEGYDAAGHPVLTWSNAGIPETNLFRVFYLYEVPYGVYEPWHPDGGYWATETLVEDRGTTTGTSYTDPSLTRTGDSSCGASYSVQPYYPSGKGATRTSGSLVFETC